MLGITPGRRPKFVKNFMAESGSIEAALKLYAEQVREGLYPSAEYGFE